MGEYRIEPSDGGFSVYQNAPVMVRETLGSPDGGIAVAVIPFAKVFKTADPAVFFTWYKGDDLWHTDEDCGAQRYTTTRPTRQIRAALRKCGFEKGEIREIIQRAMKGRK